MPSRQVTRSNYRRAKCCGTCSRENKRYCGLLGVPVRPDMVCDSHTDDPRRAAKRTLCAVCAFGLNGDHSCADGCLKKKPADSGCYAGRTLA